MGVDEASSLYPAPAETCGAQDHVHPETRRDPLTHHSSLHTNLCFARSTCSWPSCAPRTTTATTLRSRGIGKIRRLALEQQAEWGLPRRSCCSWRFSHTRSHEPGLAPPCVISPKRHAQ